jgi:hypothetical protein
VPVVMRKSWLRPAAPCNNAGLIADISAVFRLWLLNIRPDRAQDAPELPESAI